MSHVRITWLHLNVEDRGFVYHECVAYLYNQSLLQWPGTANLEEIAISDLSESVWNA